MGYAIFRLSLFQLWRNRGAAFWASRFWFPAMAAAGLVMALLPTDPDQFSAAGYLLTFLFALVAALAVVFAGYCAMSIAWHRYILREEYPDGVVLFRDDIRFGRYMWSTIKLFAVVILLVGVLLSFLLSFAYPLAPQGMSVIGYIGLFLVRAAGYWLVMRFGLVLPAVALGENLMFRESWALTRPVAVPLVLTAALVAAILEAPSIIGSILSPAVIDLTESGSVTAVLLLELPFTWLGTFAIAGVLNVLFGHLRENRPI